MKILNRIKPIFFFILVLISSVSLFVEMYIASTKMNRNILAYNKESKINYVTYLKNNNHYSSNYLESDYNFVSTLIDYFNVDYNYIYTLNENINYNLEYEVLGLLEVYDSDNDTKPIEKQNYQLVEKTTKEDNGQLIKVDILNQKIDYSIYNKIVEMWKKEVIPDAKLTIIFKVNWKGYSESLQKEISDSFTNQFMIPISAKTITISNPPSISDTGYITATKAIDIKYTAIMISTSVVLVVSLLLFIIRIVNKNKNRSKYDYKIHKILREFDRAITEAKGTYRKNNSDFYIEVKEFMELMDVHDNLNQPIIYYKNSDNESVFIVRDFNDIYYFKMKREEYDK